MKRSKIVQVGKIGIIPLVAMMLMFTYWYTKEEISVTNNEQNIVFIQEHFNSKGELVDLYNEIGVKSVTDIKLYVKESDISIKFGSIILKWTLEEFVTPENLKALEKIYIKVYKDKKTGKLRIFYKGEELERWVS